MNEVIEKPPTRAKKPRTRSLPVMELLLKCPRCQHPQREYVYRLVDKTWLKCQACQEMSAFGAWGVIYLTNDGKYSQRIPEPWDKE